MVDSKENYKFDLGVKGLKDKLSLYTHFDWFLLMIYLRTDVYMTSPRQQHFAFSSHKINSTSSLANQLAALVIGRWFILSRTK